MFMHIPITEFMNLANSGEFEGVHAEPIYCSAMNTGVFHTVKEYDVCEWIVAGHDHDNDFHGIYKGIHLAYGRKTGFGSYGPSETKQGGRVFEIIGDPYEITTWIRDEDGITD
mmetsp:Transcript_32752/g.31980  ORF Transcript_32752/g.31980 Transcript_32752/m.31980 type:complete len:113 (+) Transcript_32752:333-671(+)